MLKNKKKLRRLEKNTPGYATRAAQTLVLAGALVLGGAVVNATVLSSDALAAATALEIVGGNGGAGGAGTTADGGGGGGGGGGAGAEITAGTVTGGSLTITGGNAGINGAVITGPATAGGNGTAGSVTTLTGWTGNGGALGAGGAAGSGGAGSNGVAGTASSVAGNIFTGGALGDGGTANNGGKGGSGGSAGLKMTGGTLAVDSLDIQGGQGAITASGGNASLLVSGGALTVNGLTAIGTQATGAAKGGSSSLVIDGTTGQVNFNESVTVGAAANSSALLQVGGNANGAAAGTNGSATFKKDLTIAATGKLVIGGTGGAGGAGAGGTGTLNFDGTSTVTGAIVAGGTGGADAATVGIGGTGNINILSGTTTFANAVTLGGAQGATLATKGDGGAGNLNVLGGATAIFNDVVTVGQANSTASTLKIGGDANGTTTGGDIASATMNKKLTVDVALGSLKLGGDGSAASGATNGAAGGDGVLTLAGADKHAIGSALVLGGAGKDKAAGNGGNGGAGTLILEQDADFAAVTLGGAGGAGAGAGIEGKGGKGTIFVNDGVTAAVGGNLAVGGQAANGGNGELVIDSGGIVTVTGTSTVGNAGNTTGTVAIGKTGKLVQATAANAFTISNGTVTAYNYKSADVAGTADYGLVGTKVSINGADAVLKLMGNQTISKLQVHGTPAAAGIEVANGTLVIDGTLTLAGNTVSGDTHSVGANGVLQAQTLVTGITSNGFTWIAGTLKLVGDGNKDTVVLDAPKLALGTAGSKVTFAAADATGGGTYKGVIGVNNGLMTFGKGDWSVQNATNTGTVDVATTATGVDKGLLVTGGGNLTVDRLWLAGDANAVIGDGTNASVLTVAGNTTTLGTESFKNPTDSAVNIGIEVKNLSSLKVKYEQVLKDNALVAAADGKIKVNPGAMLYLDGSPALNATQLTALKGLLLGGTGLLNLGGATLGLTDEQVIYDNVNGITSDSLLTKSMKLTVANAGTGVSGGFGSLTVTDAVTIPLDVNVNSTLILAGGAQGTQLVNATVSTGGKLTLAVAADQVLTFGNQLTATAPTYGTLTGDVSLAAGTSPTQRTTFNAVNGAFDVKGSLNVLGANTLTNVSNADLTVKSIVNTAANKTTVNVTDGSLNVTSGAAIVGAVRLDGGTLANTDKATTAAPTNGDLTVDAVTTAYTATGAVNMLSAGNNLVVANFTDGTTTGKISRTGVQAGGNFNLTSGGIDASSVTFDVTGNMTATDQHIKADKSILDVGGMLATGNGNIALSASEGSVGQLVTAGDLSLTKGTALTLTATEAIKASSVNNLVVGENVVAAVPGSGSAATLDVKGKLSMVTGEIYNGSTVTVNELDATGLVRVGSTDDMAGSSLIINKLTANSTGTFFVDPAAHNSIVQVKDTTTPLTQDFIAGNNGIVSFGQHGMDWTKTQIAASGMTNPSVLVMASAVTLNTGAQILVGDKYQSDGSWITPGAPDTYGLAIRGNSLVIVDATNWEADATGITLNGVAGSVARDVLIEKSTGLHLSADALKANESRMLVSGINDAYQTAGGSVLGDNTTLELGKTSTNYMLIGMDDVVYNTGAGSTGFITAGTRLINATSVLPHLSNSMGNYLDGMAISTGFNSNSSSAGIRFVSRALDRRYLGENNARLAAATIEGAAQMGAVAGVQISTIGAANAASGAVTTRTSFAQPLMDMSKAVAVHQDVDGALSLDNGLSAGNGMKNGLGVWIMPLYQSNRTWGHKAENFKSGMSSDLGGIALGADYTIDDMFRFGAAFNVGGGYAESDGDFNKTDNRFNFWGVNLYGGWSMNNFGLSADVGYTSNYNKVEQDTPMALGLSNLKSDITSSAWTAGLKGEYKFETSVVDIIPHVGVRYMGLTTDSYDVKSGGTVFAVEQDFQSIWTFPIGVAFNKTITTDSGWMFKPQIDLSVIPAVGDIKAKSKSKIPGMPGSAEMKMQVVDDVTFDGGLGLEMGKDNLSFGINYNLQASEHRTGHGVFGTLRYEF